MKAILGHDDTLRLGASWPTHSIPNLLKLRATEMADSDAMHWLCLGRAGQFHSGLAGSWAPTVNEILCSISDKNMHGIDEAWEEHKKRAKTQQM